MQETTLSEPSLQESSEAVASKTLLVAAIREGTVIDHLPAGQALKIISLLQLHQGKQAILVGMHLSSRSMGYKDLIKIENRFLTEKESSDIAVFAPRASINKIENYQVTHKQPAQLPSMIKKILICPNPRCITHQEPIDSLFSIESFKNTIYLRCGFCEHHFERNAIEDRLSC